MNKRDLERFKKTLTIERERFAKEVDSLAERNVPASDNSNFSIHMAEHSNEEEELTKNLFFLSKEGDTLSQIDHALKRIDDGTYGTCERCDGKIGKDRLIAKPFAQFCIECQVAKENNP